MKIKWIRLLGSAILFIFGLPSITITLSVFYRNPDALYYSLNTFTGFAYLLLSVGIILIVAAIILLYKSVSFKLTILGVIVLTIIIILIIILSNIPIEDNPVIGDYEESTEFKLNNIPLNSIDNSSSVFKDTIKLP